MKRHLALMVVVVGFVLFFCNGKAKAHYYVDGMNLYEYVKSNPTDLLDPAGTNTATNPIQNISSDEHHNYQTFTLLCPPGSKVANISVDYAGMDDAVKSYIHESPFQDDVDRLNDFHTVKECINGQYGGIKNSDPSNCNGQPVKVNIYMRTRLVGGGILGWFYRGWYAEIPNPTDMAAAYRANTQVHYDCIACKK